MRTPASKRSKTPSDRSQNTPVPSRDCEGAEHLRFRKRNLLPNGVVGSSFSPSSGTRFDERQESLPNRSGASWYSSRFRRALSEGWFLRRNTEELDAHDCFDCVSICATALLAPARRVCVDSYRATGYWLLGEWRLFLS